MIGRASSANTAGGTGVGPGMRRFWRGIAVRGSTCGMGMISPRSFVVVRACISVISCMLPSLCISPRQTWPHRAVAHAPRECGAPSECTSRKVRTLRLLQGPHDRDQCQQCQPQEKTQADDDQHTIDTSVEVDQRTEHRREAGDQHTFCCRKEPHDTLFLRTPMRQVQRIRQSNALPKQHMALSNYLSTKARPETWEQETPDRPSQRVTRQTER